jgi:tripartite-type tricarboxylate transporter receptor subunit TctC
MKNRIKSTAFAAALLAAAGLAHAQSYPSHPVRLVVPFAPGGTTDIVARIVAAKIGPYLGQQMVVDNKAGAGGAIGAAEIAKIAPDGYNLGMATVSTVATNPAMFPATTTYDPVNDFTPIVNVAATPNVIEVNPSFPAHDYKGFVAEIKAHPDKYSYASTGTGSITHMQMELFKAQTGLSIVHVPYKGAGPALNDIMGNQVGVMMDNMPSSFPYIKAGKLIPIVVASDKRVPGLDDVPTLAEVGLPQVNRMAFYGIYGPKGLPAEVVAKVNAAVRKVLQDPEVRKRIEETGSVVIGNSPQEFASQIKNEFEVYKAVVKAQNLKPE